MVAKKREELSQQKKKTLSEILADLGPVPEEELNKIPADASINYKHYLYGFPKEES